MKTKTRKHRTSKSSYEGGEQSGTHVNNKDLVLRGVIIPVDRDDQGNILTIALATNQEDEYIISAEGAGNTLFQHLQGEVEVRGVAKVVDGEKVFVVQEYRQIKRESDW